mmetsp:Transcript_10220/g.22492  ORF Transcript_10220/g.22492 Transcript_10220/m.22492 type:complete len:201 (-) Transcript_10220:4223-4825(-)
MMMKLLAVWRQLSLDPLPLSNWLAFVDTPAAKVVHLPTLVSFGRTMLCLEMEPPAKRLVKLALWMLIVAVLCVSPTAFVVPPVVKFVPKMLIAAAQCVKPMACVQTTLIHPYRWRLLYKPKHSKTQSTHSPLNPRQPLELTQSLRGSLAGIGSKQIYFLGTQGKKPFLIRTITWADLKLSNWKAVSLSITTIHKTLAKTE